MKRKKIQLILLILTITSLILLVGIQISWVLKSARMQEAQFNHTVTLAMNRIVENLSQNQDICSEMNNCLRSGKSHSCFLLMKNRMEWVYLDTLINNDLKYYNINLDYEFDIVEKGAEVSLISDGDTYINDNLEKVLEQAGYELRLRFPEKSEFIKAQIGYIFISSIALLLLVNGSFILIYKFYKRERKLTENIIDFINNMTHEFKTPLTNIALANGMLSKNEIVEKDQKLASYSKVIKNEHQRLKEKVQVLLQAALSENGNPFRTEQFDAAFEIKNVVDTFTVRINERKGSFSVNSSGNNFTLSGNIEMFQVAIGNLIDNAIKYNSNSPRIIIDLKSDSERISISISDNGKGIRKENLPRIFEKFYRIPTGDIHENEGFGLGLYFVKNTVAQMHGNIRVTSNMDKGTTFTLVFPVSKG
ncbi:MAG: HAMP domain-containing sensor histidine kinase [Bacteroidales bacterium]|nr:HAMP domain-containing sensor histidine kinase [Bacteroidales bacterium]